MYRAFILAILTLALAVIGTSCENTKTETIMVPRVCPEAPVWTSQNPRPLGSNHFYSVYGVSSTCTYAVGANGTIARFDSTGWSLIEGATNGDIMHVWGYSDNNVYAVTAAGYVLHRYRSDVPWALVHDTGGDSLMSIWGSAASGGSSARDIWAVGSSSYAYYCHEFTWGAVSLGGYYDLNDIWGSDRDDIYAVGDDGMIMRYDGSTWSEVDHGLTLNRLTAVWGSGASDVWTVGSAGTILRFDGSGWRLVSDPLVEALDLTSVWGTGASDVYIAGSQVVIHYDGSVFTDITDYDLMGQSIAGIWAGPGVTVAVGCCGSIYTYGEHGGISSWALAQPLSGNDLMDVHALTPTDAWAVGQRGTILHYGGTAWNDQSNPALRSDLYAVSGPPHDIYAVGADGAVYHSDGNSWTDITNLGITSEDLFGVCVSWTDGFAVGDQGTIIHITGTTLTAMTSNTNQRLMAVWSSSPVNVYAVGENGTIMHYIGTVGWGAWAWQYKFASIHFRGIWGTGNDDIYVCGDSGIILHYDGSSWSRMATDTHDSFSHIWGSASDDIFALASNKIYHFNGIRWEVERPLFNSASLHGISGSAADDVFAVGQGGAIIHYGN